jgi:acetylornithine deacetylase
VDAIGQMGRILQRVVGLDQKLRKGRGHPLLGTGSIHASLIEGGQEWSTYPARCLARLERRTIPGEDGASSVREIEELIADAHRDDSAVDASVEVSLERAASEVGADDPVSRAVAEAAKAATGNEPDAIGVAYWMDMALLNEAGIPTVAFGPSGEGAHADVEWVDLSSVETCVRVYLRAAEILCNGSGR